MKNNSMPFFEIAENGADKVLCKSEKNSSVHMKYVNFSSAQERALDATLYQISSGRAFFRRMLQMRRNFLTPCTLIRTQGKKLPADMALCGRSMVEMLGVLAIIGVLSIGAIAGYQKAMTKYKLNKQTQQLDTIMSIMTQYKQEWKVFNGSATFVALVPYYAKMKLIPEDMLKANSNTIYDVFKNGMYLRTNGCNDKTKVCGGTILTYTLNQNMQFDVCQNIFQTTRAYASELSSINVYTVSDTDQGQETNYGHSYYGDNNCTSGRKCLRDITLDEMHQACQSCLETKTCILNIQWPFK